MTDSGKPPPTRFGNPESDDDHGLVQTSGGKVAMFALAIAVVLGAVFYGLNHVGNLDKPKLGGTYGGCAVSDEKGYGSAWTFKCPETASFEAAVAEFLKKNPGYEKTGIIIQEKKK